MSRECRLFNIRMSTLINRGGGGQGGEGGGEGSSLVRCNTLQHTATHCNTLQKGEGGGGDSAIVSSIQTYYTKCTTQDVLHKMHMYTHNGY